MESIWQCVILSEIRDEKLTIALTFGITMKTFAAYTGEKAHAYQSDDCTITYSIANEWSGNQQITVPITNDGEETLRNWAIMFDDSGGITNIWNAEVCRNDGELCVIRNNGYNYESKIKISYWDIPILPINSDPTIKDIDGDNYNDDQDLAPLTSFMNPIMLIHGRTSNSFDTFGIHTSVCPYDSSGKSETKRNNDVYGKNFEVGSIDYGDVTSHLIDPIGIDKNKFGNCLIIHYYEPNKNLFAFNYPNEDFAKNNALKLAEYIENIKKCVKVTNNPKGFLASASDIFATKDDLENNHAGFILIGHSNGGLVSRYYIEKYCLDVSDSGDIQECISKHNSIAVRLYVRYGSSTRC